MEAARNQTTARLLDRCAVAVVFLSAALFRWLTLAFDNDDFMHLAWAAQMLHGDTPVRDFVEPGFILQTLVAYAGLRAGGYQLFWEGLVASVLIGAGAAFTFAVCRRLRLPIWMSMAAALLTVAAYPREYAYPKALVYPAALWTLARYLQAPSRRTLTTLATATAVAFLFRHDHGAWISVTVVVALAVHHGGEPAVLARALGRWATVATLIVLPWAGWVLASGHAVQYASLLMQPNGLAARLRTPRAAFAVDHGAPWIAVLPAEEPHVRIRWTAASTAAQRRKRERRYGLQPVSPDGDEYRLTNPTRSNVVSLLGDPDVEDTSGIDRGSGRVPAGAFAWGFMQAQKRLPLLRLRILPGIVNGPNAETWLALVTFALPWLALALAVARFVSLHTGGSEDRPVRDGRHDTGALHARAEAVLVIATATLGLIVYQTLVRDSTDSRLGDVASVTAILLAWASRRAWTTGGWSRFAFRAVTAIAFVLTIGAAMSYGRVVSRLSAAGVDGPTNLVRRIGDVAREYRQRPLTIFGPTDATGVARLSRWLNACTTPTERVVVIGFEPQVFVISERAFAGGLAFYDVGWNSSPADQRLALSRWAREQVPVVLAMDAEWPSFIKEYPEISSWMQARYDPVRHSNFGGTKGITVWIARDAVPTGADASTSLPCFSTSGNSSSSSSGAPRPTGAR
jgi:hypothetical protein